MALSQCLVPLVAYPLFGEVYRATLSTSFPGAYLMIVCGLLALAFVSGIYLTIEERINKEEDDNS